MKKPQWRSIAMAAYTVGIGLVHRNLIAAYPDKNTSLLKISAKRIFEKEVKNVISRRRKP